MIKKIREILNSGEGISVEFKESKRALTKDVFETICAFLNRNGGEILLGVNDKKEIIGIEKDSIESIKKDLVSTLNNSSKISPTVYLSIEEFEIDDKKILYIFVPASSQVHKCSGKIFDRNEDGDFNISDNHNLVTKLYMNKQTFYTETKIYPYCTLDDLRIDLIEKARKMAVIQRENHPWKNMDNLEVLRSTKLYTKDYQTNQEGFNLACILLFGKDETILSVVPHYKTDLILRKNNLDRYDDRDDVRTNLLDSYERIMSFFQKHLMDPFYLEGTQRISIRDAIFREIAANILIHREYFNAFPAKIIIENDKIYAENGNKPHGHGVIDAATFSPYPKNPTIARIFKEIGYAEELGSGIKNISKYIKEYQNSKVQFIEEDIFKVIITLGEHVTHHVIHHVTHHEEKNKTSAILQFCLEPKSRDEIQSFLGLSDRNHFRINILNPLISQGLLQLTIPDKPKSPKQRYISKKILPL